MHSISTPRALAFPRGAWLIIGVEFWERFSFYGMLTIFALFLTAEPASGGFGWPTARALGLLGAYTGLMYALPAFGGYLADRVFGRRRAVTIGASLLFVGQALMASPAYVPWLLGAWQRAPLVDALHHLGAPLGYLIRPGTVKVAIAAQGALLGRPDGIALLSEAYTTTALGLYAALTCLILGNALMKSTMVVLCGDTFAVGDVRREAAYAYYYLGIAVGSLLSGLIVGSVAEAFGWSWGFAIGAIGIAFALAMYRFLGPRWLGSIGTRPEPRLSRAEGGVESTASKQRPGLRFALLFILSLLLCIFSAGWFQMYGSWSLFVDRYVDRSIGHFLIPVPWLASWNSLIVIATTPIAAALWMRARERRQTIDILHKYTFALATISGGHFLIYAEAALRTGTGYAPLWIPLIAYALSAVGEVVAWTSTYDIVYRTAPRGFVSAAMGAWYLMTLGLGGYLSGFSGAWIESIGFAATFLTLGIVFCVLTIATYLARAPLLRLADDIGVEL